MAYQQPGYGYPPIMPPPRKSKSNVLLALVVVVVVIAFIYMSSNTNSETPVDTSSNTNTGSGNTGSGNTGGGTTGSGNTDSSSSAPPTGPPPTCDDPVAYYYHYAPDIKAAGVDAEDHWYSTGYKEGRKSCWPAPPSCDTDPYGYYYFFSPEVKAAGVNAFEHWVTNGIKEGRRSCWSVRQHTDRLTSDWNGGSRTLLEGEEVHSPNKMFYLTLQADGNLVLYDIKKKAKWAAGTKGKGVIGGRTVTLHPDGNLDLRSDGKVIWETKKRSTNGPFAAVVQNDGNFVIYDKSGKAIWDAR